jgi:hypothetical protein
MSDDIEHEIDQIGRLIKLRAEQETATGKNRRAALTAAMYADHALPPPLTGGTPAACTHDRGDDNCHCKFSDDEYEGNIRLIEEAATDRIMRTAQRFYLWITAGLTMADEHHAAFLDMLDAGADGDDQRA